MRTNKMEYKIIKYSLIIASAGLVIFLGLIPIDYSLSVGWVAGAFASVLGYLIGILLINAFFKKGKSKSLGFWVGMARFYINLAFQAILFIAIIAIDKSANGHSFLGGDMHDMYSPINLFTYIGGISIILISTLVAQYLSRKEGGNGSIRREI